jgi:hypothetical protein
VPGEESIGVYRVDFGQSRGYFIGAKKISGA